jgi:two-component system, NarL family, response regulator DesR
LTSILLIADMTLLRRALAVILSHEDGFEVLADCDVAGAADAARRGPVDVAVIDLNTRRSAASNAIRAITDCRPGCAILALTGTTPPAGYHRGLDPQVRGFLSVNADPADLVAAIRRVAAGERFIEPCVARAALRAPRSPLTAREAEVLRLAAEGLSGVDIAATLFLSEGTVRNYLSVIVRKLGARGRLDAIRTATEANWL